MKKRLIIITFIVISIYTLSGIDVFGQSLPYTTYTIDRERVELASPAAYVPHKIVDGNYLGVGKLSEPSDFIVTQNYIFILDSGNNRIIRSNRDFKETIVISEFDRDGESEKFNNPQGITIDEDGELYIADTYNSRIVKLSLNGELIEIFNKPAIDFLGEDFVYYPLKIGVDKAKRIYVISQGVNRGLMELNSSGSFVNFFGAPRVQFDLAEYLWKRFGTTEQQRNRMIRFVPTEYSNLYIDDEGFVYTTTNAYDEWELYVAIVNNDRERIKPIKRLNPSGFDVLRRFGFTAPVGDVNYTDEGSVRGLSSFVDIVVDSYGTYSCLDSKRGRIFTYSYDGDLLHVFGGLGNQEGTFSIPTAIDKIDDMIIVLDKALGRLTLFNPTAYGECLNDAVKNTMEGEYDKALLKWEESIKMNSNFLQGYIGIGKAFYRDKNYEEAIRNLKIAEEKEYSSRAFKEYRNELIKDNFIYVFALTLVIIIILNFKSKKRKRNKGEE